MRKLMRRAKPVLFWSIVAILGAVAVARYASASTTTGTTYYIASSMGSDSNNGTSKTTPWAHMPGMAACAGNCASYTPVAGDQFVLYGGDTWTFTTAGTFSWSGTSANHIKIGGLDTTWFNASSCSAIGTVNTKAAGSHYDDQMNVRPASSTSRGVTPQMVGTSGWTINGTGNYTIAARAFGANFASFSVTPDPGTQSNVTMANSTGYYCQPRFDGANTLVSGCAASGGAACDFINITGSYVEVDNLDISRWVSPDCNNITCYQAAAVGTGPNAYFINNFAHDWSNSASSVTEFGQWGTGTFGGNSATIQGNVCTQLNSLNGTVGGDCFWLGSGTNPGTATGNVCMWVNDCLDGQAVGMVANGNVGYDWYTSLDSHDHGNWFHDMCSSYFYDNIAFGWQPNGPGVSSYLGEPLGGCPAGSHTSYSWNNVTFSGGNQTCFEAEHSINTYYSINDTCSPPGSGGISSYAVRVAADANGGCPLAFYVINMHIISTSYAGTNNPQTGTTTTNVFPIVGYDSTCTAPPTTTINTVVAMSTSTAASQGYTAANFYQPKSGSNSTVAKGTNMASNCTGALQNLCTALNILTPSQLGPKRPLAGTGNWDAGAYQFASNTGSLPAAPTNLTAVVTTQ